MGPTYTGGARALIYSYDAFLEGETDLGGLVLVVLLNLYLVIKTRAVVKSVEDDYRLKPLGMLFVWVLLVYC